MKYGYTTPNNPDYISVPRADYRNGVVAMTKLTSLIEYIIDKENYQLDKDDMLRIAGAYIPEDKKEETKDE